MEQKQSGGAAQAEKEICVCGMFNGLVGELFEADNAMDLLQLACLLRGQMKKPDAIGLNLADAFGVKRIIDRESFDLRVEAFMAGAHHIRGVFSIDLKRKQVFALDRAEGWMDYLFKDLSAAAYYANLKEGRTRVERRTIFLRRLEGKMQNRPLHPDAPLAFGMLD